ncbi:peptidoglycan-binding protein [Amycolatopsis sp. NPDC004378]
MRSLNSVARRFVRGLAVVLPALLLTGVATASVAGAATPDWPVLSSGSSGANVSAVQFLLRYRGYTVTADGSFGSQTKSSVQSFQAAQNISGDGVVGSVTWERLVPTLNSGDGNDAVRAAQTLLNKSGYGLTVDGSFGAKTVDAINAFKSAHGLTGGSQIGTTTWQWLAGSSAQGASGGYALVLDRGVLPRSEYDDPHHDYPAIDLPTSTGERTYAITAGTVKYVGDSCGLGIGINADDGAYYQYCHLSSRSVSSGARVSAGNLVGYTGATGHVTGPHLHFEVRVYGANRCPQAMLLALYDGTSVPAPSSLASSGCTY